MLLRTLDDLASEDSSSLRNRSITTPLKDDIKTEFRAQGLAFDHGLIPCQRLVEIYMAPFLKLARKAFQLQGTSYGGLLEEYASCCSVTAATVIYGDLVQDSRGVQKIQQVLQPHKRSELVEALLKANAAEVRSLLLIYYRRE